MKKTGVVIRKIILILLAAAILAGVPTAAAVHYYRAYTQSREQAEAESSQAEQDLTDLRQELDAAQKEIDRLRQPVPTPEPTPEPTQDPFDPDHPSYEDLYPDFYAPQELDASQSVSGVIYLTFDDGPSARTDEVLEILEQEGIKATFFVVGQTSEANLERMKKIVEQGHTLGMHSYSHSYRKIYTSVEAFLDDMYLIFTQIRDTTGVTPTFFRFPGGSVNAYNYGIYQDIMAEMLRRGFVPCDWNLSAQDATATPLPVETVISNVMGLVPGKTRGVVLMHDSSARTTTAQALPEIIRQLREAGYTFAALTPEVKPVLLGYRAIK